MKLKPPTDLGDLYPKEDTGFVGFAIVATLATIAAALLGTSLIEWWFK